MLTQELRCRARTCGYATSRAAPGSGRRTTRKRRGPAYGVASMLRSRWTRASHAGPKSSLTTRTTRTSVARMRSSRRFSSQATSPGVRPSLGSKYFTRPSNSSATAASSYQASTRPANPRSSRMSTCSSGRGRPLASSPSRPLVSRGDSARPSDRPKAPTERAAVRMRMPDAGEGFVGERQLRRSVGGRNAQGRNSTRRDPHSA